MVVVLLVCISLAVAHAKEVERAGDLLAYNADTEALTHTGSRWRT
jgi:hypothetical protein